jgi:SAM-dependent methyltransferase
MKTSFKRLERFKSVLACPACQGTLTFKDTEAACLCCAARYPIRDRRIYFIEVAGRADELDTLKGRLKNWLGKYYYKIGVNVIAPTYPFNYPKKILEFFDVANQLVVDLGCGNHKINENILGLDFFDYDAVDVVCNMNRLPFKPDSVDGFVSRSVLEHVPDPFSVVRQLHDKTIPGGYGIHLIPFLFPFHASPDDFMRFTREGQKILFCEWQMVEQTNPTGPVTLFLLCLIEFLSILLSFGNSKVKGYVYLLLCAALFPLKYLDVIFVHHKSFLPMAPSILSVVRKRENASKA